MRFVFPKRDIACFCNIKIRLLQFPFIWNTSEFSKGSSECSSKGRQVNRQKTTHHPYFRRAPLVTSWTTCFLEILLISYKALNNLAPTYLSELVKLYVSSRNLRSFNTNRLISMSYNLKTYGYRAVSSAAPALWNELPHNIRRCGCLNQF